jgi:hypothetical protein
MSTAQKKNSKRRVGTQPVSSQIKEFNGLIYHAKGTDTRKTADKVIYPTASSKEALLPAYSYSLEIIEETKRTIHEYRKQQKPGSLYSWYENYIGNFIYYLPGLTESGSVFFKRYDLDMMLSPHGSREEALPGYSKVFSEQSPLRFLCTIEKIVEEMRLPIEDLKLLNAERIERDRGKIPYCLDKLSDTFKEIYSKGIVPILSRVGVTRLESYNAMKTGDGYVLLHYVCIPIMMRMLEKGYFRNPDLAM